MKLKSGCLLSPFYLLGYMSLGLNCAEQKMASVSSKPRQFLVAESSTNSYYTVAYPFLTHNPFPIRLAIYGGATTLGAFSFLAMNALHS